MDAEADGWKGPPSGANRITLLKNRLKEGGGGRIGRPQRRGPRRTCRGRGWYVGSPHERGRIDANCDIVLSSSGRCSS